MFDVGELFTYLVIIHIIQKLNTLDNPLNDLIEKSSFKNALMLPNQTLY